MSMATKESAIAQRVISHLKQAREQVKVANDVFKLEHLSLDLSSDKPSEISEEVWQNLRGELLRLNGEVGVLCFAIKFQE